MRASIFTSWSARADVFYFLWVTRERGVNLKISKWSDGNRKWCRLCGLPCSSWFYVFQYFGRNPGLRIQPAFIAPCRWEVATEEIKYGGWLYSQPLRILSGVLYFILFHYTVLYRVFSHDVTAATLVSQNNETAAISCWCPKQILWELNSFLIQTLSFVPINLRRCWSREWKHSILFHFISFHFLL